MDLDYFGPKVDDLLQKLHILQYERKRRVATDGDCFYDSVYAVAFEDPVVRATLHERARGITNIKVFRISLATFMRDDPLLRTLHQFTRTKEVTLAEEGLSWNGYLKRIATTKEYADQLTIMCTPLFCGKDIEQISDGSTIAKPWTTIPGQVEDWPYSVTGPPIKLAYFHQGKHYEPLHPRQAPAAAQVRSLRAKTPSTPTKAPATPSKSPEKRRHPPASTEVPPKSPLKSKQHPIGETNTRVTRSALRSSQDGVSSQPKSPDKSEETCKGCGWTGPSTSILKHIGQKPECEASNDVEALRLKAKIRNSEKNAARMKDLYIGLVSDH